MKAWFRLPDPISHPAQLLKNIVADTGHESASADDLITVRAAVAVVVRLAVGGTGQHQHGDEEEEDAYTMRGVSVQWVRRCVRGGCVKGCEGGCTNACR